MEMAPPKEWYPELRVVFEMVELNNVKNPLELYITPPVL